MAGDWIKMRSNLWDDPRIGRLADITETSDAAVIGGLYWLWSTSDQHTEDGFMPGLSTRRIDAKTGVKGLGDALVSIGWIEAQESGIQIVNFEDHNGASAKKRCQTAKRVASFKAGNASDATSDDEGNAASVSAALLERDLEKRREEEEKRREEESLSSKTVGAAKADKPAKNRGARLAEGWVLPKGWGDWALADYPHWTADVVRLEASKFADHWHSKVGKDATKLDWEATWRSWCRSDICQRSHPMPRNQRPSKPSQMTEGDRATWEQSETEKSKRLLFGDVVEVDGPTSDGIEYESE